jgi:hypothetical protein
MGNNAPKRVFHALRLETERAGIRFVAHPSIPINHVKAIRPARVGALGAIIESIDDCWKLNTEPQHAQLSHVAAFVETLRARKNDLVIEIIGILPNIAGVRLTDVNHIKRDAVAVLLVDFVESGNLPPKRRSRITAEYEDHGLFAAQR